VSEALPNFFIVGAPKAGTTSLYHYLDQHPEIYMSPIKEPNYFASEIRLENVSEELRPQARRDMDLLREYLNSDMREKRFGGMVSEWGDYLKLFHNVTGEKAVGEASACYLWSQTAGANIRAKVPDARIIMVLRNPADRAFSQYWHAISLGVTRQSFGQAIRSSTIRRSQKFDVLYPLLEFGLYGEHVKRYLDLFPRHNVGIYIYEDYQERFADMLADIFEFLNVDANFTPDLSEKHLEARIPQSIQLTYLLKKSGVWQHAKEWCPNALRPILRSLAFRQRRAITMEPNDRRYLLSYYREDVRKLSELLDRDLLWWLN
jgi:hypothetical protein